MATGMLIPPRQFLFELAEDNQGLLPCVLHRRIEKRERKHFPVVIWLQLKRFASLKLGR